MYTCRDVREDDFETIVLFPQNEDELFFMFPRTAYPLTPCSLGQCASERYEPTVFLYDGQLAGYANIIKVKKGECGTVGNIIVSPLFRGKRLGRYILDVMSQKLKDTYSVNELRLSCFSENISGLLLYQKYGLTPFEMEIRTDRKGSNTILIHLRKKI